MEGQQEFKIDLCLPPTLMPSKLALHHYGKERHVAVAPCRSIKVNFFYMSEKPLSLELSSSDPLSFLLQMVEPRLKTYKNSHFYLCK